MAEVYLDGNRIDFVDDRNDATIGELMAAIETELKDHRRFVFELWVDGEKVEKTSDDDLLSSPISLFSDFEFKTVSIESLALEGVDTVQEYLRVIRENLDDCVEEMRRGGPNVEVLLRAITEGIVEVIKTTDALLKGVEKYSIELFRENPARYYKSLLKFLDTITDAANTGDSIMVSDTLAYELKPLIEEIESTIFYKADH